MGKYRVTWERTESGKSEKMPKETFVDSVLPPRVGESRTLFSAPSVRETITKVEEL